MGRALGTENRSSLSTGSIAPVAYQTVLCVLDLQNPQNGLANLALAMRAHGASKVTQHRPFQGEILFSEDRAFGRTSIIGSICCGSTQDCITALARWQSHTWPRTGSELIADVAITRLLSAPHGVAGALVELICDLLVTRTKSY